MAKAVTKFVAASGASYDSEHDAWSDDLLSFFMSSLNEGTARAVVAQINTEHGCDQLGTILAGLQTSRMPQYARAGPNHIDHNYIRRCDPEPITEEQTGFIRVESDEERRFRLFEDAPARHVVRRHEMPKPDTTNRIVEIGPRTALRFKAIPDAE